MIKKIIENDNVVKLIFDHFRNVGISAVILSAAAWASKSPTSGWLGYIQGASVIALSFLGIFLFVLNERHGSRKFREANLPWGWQLVGILIYGLSVFQLLASLLIA